MKAVLIGVLASLFFSTTFLLNRSMSLEGGSFAWSAALRFLFMMPPLFLIVWMKGNLQPLLADVKKNFSIWLKWGMVGFGVFYTLTCFAADYGPGWLIASTWQITILCGPLLAPLFGEKIPWKSFIWSLFILFGVIIIQYDNAKAVSVLEVILSVIPLLIAAIVYPLGNRKMMSHCNGRLDAFSRMLGMCIGSLPCWILLCAFGYATDGGPTASQVTQSLLVALCSGLIATSLFFYATDLASSDQNLLAMVEATQSTQVIFTLAGELVLLHGAFPSSTAILGVLIVCLGIVLQSVGRRIQAKKLTHSNS